MHNKFGSGIRKEQIFKKHFSMTTNFFIVQNTIRDKLYEAIIFKICILDIVSDIQKPLIKLLMYFHEK